MSFVNLLAKLDAMGTASMLAKSDPADGAADDANIAAAAEDGAGEGGEGDAAAAEGAEGAEGGEGEGLEKSFKVKLEDGSEADAIDATDLIKSLTDQVGDLAGRLDGAEGDMLKAMTSIVDLVKSQATTISTLEGKVDALANAGRGRKTVVTLSEKPASAGELAKALAADAEPKGLNREELLAKCDDAFNAGKITGLEVGMVETALNRGVQPNANILGRVLA